MSGRQAAETDGGWTAAEEAAVRHVLEQAGRDLTVGPPPWRELQRRYRRGTVRRAAGITAVAASVALVAGLGAGLVPGADRLGGGLGVGPAPVAGLATGGGTVGSLAGDTSFLAALRVRAVSELEQEGAADGVGRIGSAEVKAVLVATEVPGARMALVAFRVPGRPDQVRWLDGAQGAPGSRMYVRDSCDLSAPCWTRYGDSPDNRSGPDPDPLQVPTGAQGRGVILAGPQHARVVVRNGADVTAAGKVQPRAVTAQELWPGVYVAPLNTVFGRQDVEVTVPGAGTWRDWFAGGSSLDIDAWWVGASVSVPGPAVSDGVRRGDLLAAAQRATGMLAGEGDRVLWQRSSGGSDSAVIAFRGRSGGWAMAAVTRTVLSATTFDVQVDAVRALPGGDPADPAAGLDRVCLAWSSPLPGGARSVGVLGPPSAVRAVLELSGQGAGGPEVELERGTGLGLDVAGVTGVALLDATGQELARCPVSGPWKDGDVLR